MARATPRQGVGEAGFQPEDDPGHAGHRERLRRRFLEGGGAALADYELLELILFLALPRRDVKPLAKRLIARFGTFQAVLAAEPAALVSAGLGPGSAAALKAVHAAALRCAREAILDRPVMGSWRQVLDYCRAAMAHGQREEVRLLFLDAKNGLIAEERQQTGTVDQAPVYPREVARRALELGASSVILVHNHPSGDPTPSKADIAMTREVERALSALGITLHDHLIIARERHASLKGLGLM